MNNLHELTKQLDVLTWNARSVLNALIRSAMAAGSSNGFTVTRAGERIVLTKEDIYRIYHFYEKWEAAGYPTDDDTFNELLVAENACYGDGDLVTAALVKHAKTIWLDTNTAGATDEEWISRIHGVDNPKWFTNTAPIPLNIRTPIYDENLSTKTYDSYETYLFPNGYYSMDTLGVVGDNSEHTAGGKNWTFDVTDTFRVAADRYMLGIHDESRVNLLNSLYTQYKQKCSLEGGTNSFAFDRNSFAYGMNNLVNGENSAIIGGYLNEVLADKSVIIGGESNVIASIRGAIGAGKVNMIAGGDDGFAANSYNTVGGYRYYFTRSKTASSTETECPVVITNDNGCMYQLIKDDGSALDGTKLSPSQFFISSDIVSESCIGPSCYVSYGQSVGRYSPFDFKVGDLIRVFDVYVNNLKQKKACKSIIAKVIDIQKLNTDGLATVDQYLAEIGYVVTIDQDFSANTFTDLGSDSIYSGYVCRVAADNYPRVTDENSFYEVYTQNTSDSSVFGYNNITAGNAQMVVGSSNIELLRPRFIVGSGTAYITANKWHRSNSLVSAPNYTYSMTSQYIVAGVSTVTTAYIHGDDDYAEHIDYDEDYAHGVEKYKGFYAYHMPQSGEDDGRAVLRVYEKMSTLAIGWNGLRLYQPLLEDGEKQTRTVWNELYCRDGAISVHSGSFLDTGEQTTDNNWIDFYNNNVRVSDVPGKDHTVTIWAKERTGVHGHDLILHADEVTGYIHAKSFALRIESDTRGALTAQPTSHNVEPYKLINASVDTITDTGHTFTFKHSSGVNLYDIDLSNAMLNDKFNAFHVITSSHQTSFDANTNTGMYDVAQLLLPGMLSSNCTRALRGLSELPHPIVISNTVQSGVDRTMRDTPNSGYLYEELAYRSDIQALGLKVLNNIANPAYSATENYSRVDNAPTVPNMQYACVSDTFLTSLTMAEDDWFHQGHVARAVDIASPTMRLIRATSMTGIVGKINHINDIIGAPEYYLAGVAINPCFRMTQRTVNNHASLTTGITYLAFAPHELMEHNANIVIQRYQTNLQNPNIPSRTLYTSKFSPGSLVTNVADLSDIWAISVNGDDVTWQPFIRNLLIVYAGGRISVEFYINGNMLASGKFMPCKEDVASLSNGVVVDDDSSAPLFKEETQFITIPLDPTIASTWSPVHNPNTGVFAQLHGRAYYTGDENVSITGEFTQVLPSLRYNYTQPASSNQTFTYYGPFITINMAGWPNVRNLLGSEYYVCLEGVVQYAN